MRVAEELWRCCRVCGYEPVDPPWGATGHTPTYELCPCCGVEYGNEDYTQASTIEYRDRWLSDGGKWMDERHPDDGLPTSARLERVSDEQVRRGRMAPVSPVVDEFFATEVDDPMRQLLMNAVHRSTPGEERFEFNLFDVRIDRDSGVVVVEDVLDAARSEEVELAEFRRRLESRS